MKKFIQTIERLRLPWNVFVVTLLSAVTLRNFLEDFSDHHFAGGGVPALFYLQSYAFYAFFLLCFALIVHLLGRHPVDRVLKVLFTLSIIIVLPPIVDMLITGGRGLNMSYWTIEDAPFLPRFFLFFGPFVQDSGVTLGQKIELGLMFIGMGLYVFHGTKSIARGIAAGLIGYILIFLFLLFPMAAIPWFVRAGIAWNDTTTFTVYFLGSVVLLLILALRSNPVVTRALLNDMRWFRILHFLAMAILGASLAWQPGLSFDPIDGLLLASSIVFACLFALVSNNGADISIDRVSNKHRPLPSKIIGPETYASIGYAGLGLALLCAALVSHRTLLLIGLFISNYSLYSLPPLRLKRVPLLSKMFIGLNSLALVFAGYALMQPDLRTFPLSIAVAIFVIYSLVTHVIDVKDIKGDAKHHIRTLPVLLGEKNAARIISLFFLIGFGVLAVYVNDQILQITLGIFAVLAVMALHRKRYSETPIFLVYFATLTLTISHILLTKL